MAYTESCSETEWDLQLLVIIRKVFLKSRWAGKGWSRVRAEEMRATITEILDKLVVGLHLTMFHPHTLLT